MSANGAAIHHEPNAVHEAFVGLRSHLDRRILGQEVLTERLLVALLADGHLSPEDVHAVARDALRHRILLTFEAEANGWTPDSFLDRLIARVPLT